MGTRSLQYKILFVNTAAQNVSLRKGRGICCRCCNRLLFQVNLAKMWQPQRQRLQSKVPHREHQCISCSTLPDCCSEGTDFQAKTGSVSIPIETMAFMLRLPLVQPIVTVLFVVWTLIHSYCRTKNKLICCNFMYSLAAICTSTMSFFFSQFLFIFNPTGKSSYC